MASVFPHVVNIRKMQETYGNLTDLVVNKVFFPLYSEFLYVVNDSQDNISHIITDHNLTFRCRNKTAFVDGVISSPYSGLCNRSMVLMVLSRPTCIHVIETNQDECGNAGDSCVMVNAARRVRDDHQGFDIILN